MRVTLHWNKGKVIFRCDDWVRCNGWHNTVARARVAVWATVSPLLSLAQPCSEGLVGCQWAPCFAVNVCFKYCEVTLTNIKKLYLGKNGDICFYVRLIIYNETTGLHQCETCHSRTLTCDWVCFKKEAVLSISSSPVAFCYPIMHPWILCSVQGVCYQMPHSCCCCSKEEVTSVRLSPLFFRTSGISIRVTSTPALIYTLPELGLSSLA